MADVKIEVTEDEMIEMACYLEREYALRNLATQSIEQNIRAEFFRDLLKEMFKNE